MSKLQMPEFKTYEEEAAFWDNLGTAPYMEDDGEWFRFETPNPDEPEPNRKKLFVSGFYESPGSKTKGLNPGDSANPDTTIKSLLFLHRFNF